MQRKPHRNIMYLAVLMVLVLVAVTLFTSGTDSESSTMGYSQVVSYFKANQVTGFALDLNTGVITMNIKESDRAAAATVYNKYRQPFLDDIQGAHCKHLLVRDNDVQVLHGFVSVADAENYLKSDLFTQDVVVELKPYFQSEPDVRIYSVVG